MHSTFNKFFFTIKHFTTFVVMRYLAFILSFHLMTLTVAPAASMLYAKFSSERCGTSCSKSSNPEKETRDCEKQSCFTFSCCKISVFLAPTYKNSFQFQLESTLKNNFILKELFISLRPFDIWHPPKFI